MQSHINGHNKGTVPEEPSFQGVQLFYSGKTVINFSVSVKLMFF